MHVLHILSKMCIASSSYNSESERYSLSHVAGSSSSMAITGGEYIIVQHRKDLSSLPSPHNNYWAGLLE